MSILAKARENLAEIKYLVWNNCDWVLFSCLLGLNCDTAPSETQWVTDLHDQILIHFELEIQKL